MKTIYAFLLSILVLSCTTTTTTNNNSNDGASSEISAERENVNTNPVKTYDETVTSFETTDEFEVAVYETKNTFRYLIKVSYKNLEAEDTLRIPNFGIEPSVDVTKGDKRPSCIIGFSDKDQKFRESKLVYFEDNTLKFHVLKHYGVSTSKDKTQ